MKFIGITNNVDKEELFEELLVESRVFLNKDEEDLYFMYCEPICFTALENNVKIGFQEETLNPRKLYYSFDKTNWNLWEYDSSIKDDRDDNYYSYKKFIELSEKQKLYVFGEKNESINSTFITSGSNCFEEPEECGKVEISGDITSMLGFTYNDVQKFRSNTYELPDYAFYGLFSGLGSKLKKASDLKLPFMKLSPWCYYRMFKGCTDLINTPELPAVHLADSCYCEMFSGCNSLNKIPYLPAKKLETGCYEGMFKSCMGLINLNIVLNTTEIIHAQSCYQSMFEGCYNLKTAPKLLSTELVKGSYCSMFESCYSLTKTPDLPATSLPEGCYREMFLNCFSLKETGLICAETGEKQTSMFGSCNSMTTCILGFNYNFSENILNLSFGGSLKIIYYDSDEDKYYLDMGKTTECDSEGTEL